MKTIKYAFATLSILFLILLSGVNSSSSELQNHRVVLDVSAKTGGAQDLNKPGIPSNPSIDKEGESAPRTATGGIINTIMVFLTIVSFIGNALFLVYVFWLSK